MSSTLAKVPAYDPTPFLSAALEPLTSPSTATSEAVAAAVQRWTELAQEQHEGKNGRDQIQSFLWGAWSTVFDAAGKTPVDHQEKLVQFILELKKADVMVKKRDFSSEEEGQQVEVVLDAGDDWKLWRDLPVFGWEARERWNFDPFSPSDSQEDRNQQDGWVGFLARLTGLVAKEAEYKDSHGPGDYSLYALWGLREAFEGSNSIAADGSLEKGADAALASGAVKQASLWIIFAGEYLWSLSKKHKDLPERLGVSTGRFAEKEWKGFNEERWAVWKRGLEKAQEWVVGEEAKQRVKAAVEVMAKLG